MKHLSLTNLPNIKYRMTSEPVAQHLKGTKFLGTKTDQLFAGTRTTQTSAIQHQISVFRKSKSRYSSYNFQSALEFISLLPLTHELRRPEHQSPNVTHVTVCQERSLDCSLDSTTSALSTEELICIKITSSRRLSFELRWTRIPTPERCCLLVIAPSHCFTATRTPTEKNQLHKEGFHHKTYSTRAAIIN